MSKAVVFSGQGSQYVGMSADLVEAYPAAADLASTASGIVGDSLVQTMHNGPVEVLTA